MITIRRASSADMLWLAEQLQDFAQFFDTKLSLFPTDPIGMQIQLLDMMLPERGCFFIAEKEGEDGDLFGNDDDWVFERMGFIVGALHEHPYNHAITQLTELFWWVAPEYRGSSAGARLLNAFMDYGRAHADWVVMSLEAKSPIDPRSLERRGFRLQETSYLLEVAR